MFESTGVGQDLSLHEGQGPFRLEKWYIDTLLDDGSILLVYLGRLRLSGLPLGRVTAQFFPAAGTGRSGAAKVRRTRGSADGLDFGAARISGQRLSWSTAGLSGELEFSPRHGPTGQSKPFLVRGERSLNWQVEIPDADVEGEIRWPGGVRPIRGRGYRDRVWFDIFPWRFPIRRLFWGRAAGGGHAAFWTEAETDRGRIRQAWVDGRATDEWRPPVFSRPRVILDSDVVGLDALLLGPLRPLLRRLTGNPHEIKCTAATELGGEPARAIFEEVFWR
jgi:hypothetical protein